MKRLIVLALAIVVTSCNGVFGDGYKISGEIKGLNEGTSVFLEKQDENTGMPIAVDTVKVTNGKFEFEGEAKEPQLHFIRFDKYNGTAVLILEKGNISTVINKDSIGLAKFSGTLNNEELKKYNSKMLEIQKRMMNFQKNNVTKMQEAQKANDTVVMNKLNKEFSKYQEEFLTTNTKYIEENKSSFISLLLIPTLFNNPKFDLKTINKQYDALDSSLKETSVGKKIKKQLDDANKAQTSKKK